MCRDEFFLYYREKRKEIPAVRSDEHFIEKAL
jgi:hypothetical protein